MPCDSRIARGFGGEFFLPTNLAIKQASVGACVWEGVVFGFPPAFFPSGCFARVVWSGGFSLRA